MFSAPVTHFLQRILCQINIFYHQLALSMTTDFVRFTKIYTKCSEIQNLQNLSYEFQNNLSKYDILYFVLFDVKIHILI